MLNLTKVLLLLIDSNNHREEQGSKRHAQGIEHQKDEKHELEILLNWRSW